jgi:hypothetical protein
VLIVSGIEQPDETVDSLRQSRDTRPLSREALEFILGDAYKESPIGQYLGQTTWFWRLRVSKDSGTLTWILARIPLSAAAEVTVNDSLGQTALRLVEESYSL